MAAGELTKMRVPIKGYDTIDLDAPTIGAYATKVSGRVRWVFFCRHCQAIHEHGPQEGHREAHCTNPASPCQRAGYNLAFAREWARAGPRSDLKSGLTQISTMTIQSGTAADGRQLCLLDSWHCNHRDGGFDSACER
jgi:hypothetical protein